MKELDLKICTFDILLDKEKNLWLTDINPQGSWLGWNQDVDMAIFEGNCHIIRNDY